MRVCSDKEEIKKIISSVYKSYDWYDVAWINTIDEDTEKLLKLFRSWALECVGEESDGTNAQSVLSEYELTVQDAYHFQEGYDQAKQEIREKIEEATYGENNLSEVREANKTEPE